MRITMKALILLITITVLGLNLSACHSAVQPTPNPIVLAAPVETLDEDLVNANTHFAFKLYQKLRESNDKDNCLISPASISLALDMTYNGANNETKQAMAQTLEILNLDIETLNQANKDLKTILLNPDPEVTLQIANSIWVREGIHVYPDFLDLNKTYYNAEIATFDFSNPQTSQTINKWVADNTNQTIDKIVDDTIDPDTIMFLINAIYFNGSWQKAFDEKLTHQSDFTLASGEKIKADMMQQAKNYAYYETDSFQTVSLPYGNGRTSMIIFLPKPNSSLKAFSSQLNAENWQAWMASYKSKEGQIALPKFSYAYDVKLNEALKTLGMDIAFNPQAADFSKMVEVTPGRNVYIQNVKHKTFIDVSEKGTKASGVTSVEMGVESCPAPSETFNMVMDRPFFYVIRDNQTGTLLFMGTVINPINN